MSHTRDVRYHVVASLIAFSLCLADDQSIDYVRDIQPIFKQHCYQCHNQAKQVSGYALDSYARAFKGGESGTPAIVAGKPSESELIKRVMTADIDERMPPKGDGLSATEKATLTRWIERGAHWPEKLRGEIKDPKSHWAFQPPKLVAHPQLPVTADPSKQFLQNPIDQFVLARLQQEGLKPSPKANKSTLLRRLHLDLIGLPPTLEELDAFLNDNSPNAYEKAVDRLLASPHYGERWGRLWLDAARYADSDGFEKDKSRNVWYYRDWVVNALNRDLPYDQFIIQQIAGDLIDQPTQDSMVATGFLRNSMINEEGGVDPEQFRMEAMFDRMDAIGKGILGLTIQCAQCHDHKFDPITQQEYYEMFAFLNDCDEASVVAYSPQEQMLRQKIFAEIAALEAKLKEVNPKWADDMRTWEQSIVARQVNWQVALPELDTSGGQKHYLLDDGSILAAGYAPTKHTTDFPVTFKPGKIAAVRLELLTDPNLPLNGPGRSVKGIFGLTEFKVHVEGEGIKPQDLKFKSAIADVNPPEVELDKLFDDKSKRRRVTGPIAFAIDGKDETAWGIDIGQGRRNLGRHAIFYLEKPFELPKGGKVTFKLVQNHGGWNSDDNQNMNLGRFRFSTCDSAPPPADFVPAIVLQIMRTDSAQRTREQQSAIFSYWRTTVPAWKETNDQIESLWRQHPEGTPQLTLAQKQNGRETRILKRGDFLNPERRVNYGVPAVLNPLPANHNNDPHYPNRLTFARWLADANSPTTARTLVNRVWQSYFGLGMVSSVEDIGNQSEPPSHPELLDWLANQLIKNGWSQKRLHKLIVMSGTYQQSSELTPELAERDPNNRLLARASRFRVDAELVRDLALSISGLLDRRVGGRTIFPPLPEFLLQPPASYGPKMWAEDKGRERYRRGLYAFRYRSIPYPMLQNFDAPNGDSACVRRPRSNTPLQALTTLNETTFVESAQGLAVRLLADPKASDADRIRIGFRLATARFPSKSEEAELNRFLAEQLVESAKPNGPQLGLASTVPMERATGKPREQLLPASVTQSQLAAWTALSRVLLSLDETVTRE